LVISSRMSAPSQQQHGLQGDEHALADEDL
jgi:hypothetical protein